MDNVAQKLFAFYICSDTNEGVVALDKLASLGVTLDDVAENIGNGKWQTRYGNITFDIGPNQTQADLEREREKQRAEREHQRAQQEAYQRAEAERQARERTEQKQRAEREYQVWLAQYREQMRIAEERARTIDERRKRIEREQYQREYAEFQARMKSHNPLADGPIVYRQIF